MEDLKRSGPQAAPGADKAKPVSRSRKSAKKRDEIIHAAIKVINAKSFALATMTDIAAALDLRDATLYYYFPSKNALAYSCHRHSLERFERLLHESDAAGGKGAEKLKRLVHGMLADSSRNGPLLYFGDYSYLESAQRKAITEWATRLTVILEKFLQDGIVDGSIVPCETALVVQLLLGMLIWLAKWVPGIENMTVDRLMKAIGTFCLDGLER